MPAAGATAVVAAAALDRILAEPPAAVHPVAWFGRLVAPFDRSWTRPRAVGVAAAVALPLAAAGVAGAFVVASATLRPGAAGLAAGVVLFSTTSLRMLEDEARAVVGATEADLDAARERLRSLAGRDAASLSAAEVRSAAVESAAENLADGLVAPLLAFALLAPASLPLAAAGAAWVKAVNTLDSVLGYRSKPVGWASARLDDAAMWLPARLAAALIALAAFDPGALARARKLARVPASPNSGWPMATLAAAIGVRLEKPGHYALDGGKGASGTPAPDDDGAAREDAPAAAPGADTETGLPSPADAARGVAVVHRAGVAAFALAGVVAWL